MHVENKLQPTERHVKCLIMIEINDSKRRLYILSYGQAKDIIRALVTTKN